MTRTQCFRAYVRVLLVVLLGGCGDGTRTGTEVVESVGVTPPLDTLTAIGSTTQLAAQARDANGGAIAGLTASWSTSSAGTATVDGSGFVTAVAEGGATITATIEGVAGSAEIVVDLGAPVVAIVAVTPELDTLRSVGATSQLVAEARDASGGAIVGRPVAWSTSDGAIATVDGAGLVTAVSDGDARITATVDGIDGTSQIFVDIPAPGPTPPMAFRREDDASGADWLYLLRPDAGTDSLLVPSNVGRFSMAPDQSRVVYNDEDGDAWRVLDLAAGSTTVVFDGSVTGSPENATWSPTGDEIAFEDGDVLFVVDAGGTTVDTLDLSFPSGFADPPGAFHFNVVTWSPEGDEIAYRCSDPSLAEDTICGVDLATEAVRVIRPVDDDRPSWPAWSPDGEWIAYRVGGETDAFGDLVSGDEIRAIRPDGTSEQVLFVADIAVYEEVRRPTWSPGSDRIAFECHDFDGNANICFADVVTGGVTESVEGLMPKWAN